MERKKDRPEELLKEIIKLEPEEFLGICTILGVDLYEKEVDAEEDVVGGPVKEDPNVVTVEEIIRKAKLKKPKDFVRVWEEVCDKVAAMDRTKRRNLGKLLRAATK